MKINNERLWQRLMQMAQIGAIPSDGVNRQALSREEQESWRLMQQWAQASKLEICSDASGNLFVVLPGVDSQAPALLLGSHLDSQPTGGRFDGVYGVLAAMEVLTVLRENSVQPHCDVVAVSWMNEEGSRFAPGMMGSSFFSGARSLAEIYAVTDISGVSVSEALQAMQQSIPLPTWRGTFPPAGYLEVHIEQASLLEKSATTIGVVQGIQGKITWEITLRGERGHAGTVPMSERRDVLHSFTRVAQQLYQQMGDIDPQVMFTIGRIEMQPNAPSVIPDALMFRIDLRHPQAALLAALATRIEKHILQSAVPCEVEILRLSEAAPNDFDVRLQQMISASAASRGYSAMPLLSAAGHDARYLAQVCPSAMIFIPSRAGISHAPEEWSEPEHVYSGAQVLLDVVLRWLERT
ncbi:M20 family metallo-hydrolase [Pantoea vagans]|uniref:M20 family metallo-hydrolase n=1 Tax=Pantoea vagans TaxID=470934 RepID=UPI0023AEC92B|nr:M20 family metallo-hydrolase [Pantoea vagans]MDE8559178.1 M20 family metallo-hydrolase [Pantoea vagans]MDE8579173.1 M20 family metallo-hydrolase [Pantoea vagans]